MRLLILLLVCAAPSLAQHTLWATANNAKGYVVGAKLAPSGVFRKLADGEWRHAGFNHPFTSSLAAAKDGTVYLAAGNGLIEITANGEKWKILTGSDVTELRDVTVDPRDGGLYITHTRGIAASTNGGKTWRDLTGDLQHRYVESIRPDRSQARVLIAATEAGLFRSQDGAHWKLAGAAGLQVLRVEQSPTDVCVWLATTELGGLFQSRDCAKTFESVPGRVGVDRSLYDLAWDPAHAHHAAVAGFRFGVAISEDDGVTWTFRNDGLPGDRVWSVAFDPDRPGRMFASVHEEAVYVSGDEGKHWKRDGLPGSAVNRFAFLPLGIGQ